MAIMVSQLTNTPTIEGVVASMEGSEEWANDSLREMNEKGVEERDVREAVVRFRNIIEKYTEEEKGKLGTRVGVCSRFFKLVI
jgi:DNA-binding transcriptional regulator PaaX